MIETMKRIFKRKEKPMYRSQTFTIEKQMTKKISMDTHNPNALFIEQDSDFWLPFTVVIADGLAESLCNELEQLREYCTLKGFEFHFSAVENGFDKIRRKHLYINPYLKDDKVYDVDFYFNENEEIDSFSVGTRKRFFAFADEPPKVISKTTLKDFDQALEYLRKQF